ncbi:g9760 [Coccomyxa elongata]
MTEIDTNTVDKVCSSPLQCAISTSTVHLRVHLCGGLVLSRTFRLPGRRCQACRPSLVLPGPARIEGPAAPASAGLSGGLAWELRRRIERYGDVRGQLERGGEPVDEGYFERWLRAKGGVDEAEACIRAHAQWRADYVPMGRILEGEVVNELAARKCFLQGCDNEGHPVLVVWAARHDMGNRDIDETKRFICYCLDNTIAASDFRKNPGGQIKCLFDLSGLRTRNLDVKALQAIFELLQSHYPERLSALWFLNAPFIFWGVWRLVRPFIRTDETRNKIAFLSGREREETLLGTIPPHVLPVVYGGEAPLVPLEDAAQQRLSMQRSAAAAKTAGSGVSATAAGGAAGKSSRLASAGRAISRWSGASWALLKKPAQAVASSRVWGHWPRFRSKSAGGKPSSRAAMIRKASQHLRRGMGIQDHEDKHLLLHILDPSFLIQVLRILAQSAAQALLWAWTHALPVKLQRPVGDASRLPSMAPGALPPPTKSTLQHQPLVPSSPAQRAVELRKSRSEADAGSSDTASLARVQHVTWGADQSCPAEPFAVWEQTHAAVVPPTPHKALIVLAVTAALLLLSIVLLKGM